MLLFVVGLPGRFAEYCGALAAALGRAALGPTEVVSAGNLEEITFGVMRSEAANLVVQSHTPGPRLLAALTGAGRKFVVAVEDPRIAVGDRVARNGLPLAAATRQVASSCATVMRYVAAPGSLVLSPGEAGDDPAALAAALAEHFELTIAEPDRQRVVQEFGATSDAASDEDPTRWWRALSAHDRELSEGAVSPFIGGFAGASAPPIVWGAELFSSGDWPDQTAVDPIDITGRGRCLFRGPGIVLPAGPWSLTLELEFSPEAREYEFAVEVTAGPVLAAREVRPRSDVDPAIHLQFAIDEAADAPLEVRFSSRRAAFDGQLFLSHAILVPQPAAPD